MTKLFSNSLLACGFALAATTLAANAAAQAAPKAAKAGKPSSAKASAKPVVVKTSLQKLQAAEEQGPAPVVPEAEPDITGSATTQYSCELGNTITIYTNEADTANIALRWKKRLHRLTRVGTTTGAKRFENKNFGLTWIGIPAKGLLLDSRLNRQLANECKSPDQENPAVVVVPVAAVPGMLAVPAGTQSVVVPVSAGASSVMAPVPVGTTQVPPAPPPATK